MALAAVALWLWMPGLDVLGLRVDREAEAEVRREVEKEKKSLQDKLDEIAAEAKREDLPDLQKLIDSMRQQVENKKKDGQATKRPKEVGAGDAKKRELVKLTQREDLLKRARDAAKFQNARKALEQLSRTRLKNSDLTRKLLDALKKRDLKRARKELDALKNKIGKLAKKDLKRLTKEEKAELQKLAAELGKLSDKLNSMKGLSKALKNAASGLKASDLSKALQGMKLSDEELDQLAKQMQEMDLVERSLELVKLSKEQLSKLQKHHCPDCGKPKPNKPGQKPGGT